MTELARLKSSRSSTNELNIVSFPDLPPGLCFSASDTCGVEFSNSLHEVKNNNEEILSDLQVHINNPSKGLGILIHAKQTGVPKLKVIRL